jgi:phosphate starvation-inducible PhoH-like protein
MECRHSDPTQARRTDALGMPDSLVGRLTAPEAGLWRHIADALAPYKVEASPVIKGLGVSGDDVAVTLAKRTLERILEAAESGHDVDAALVGQLTDWAIDDALQRDLAFRLSGVTKPLRPMSLSQLAFMNTMLGGDCPLVFGVGPTGTGKTRLAIAAGLSMLASEHVQSLVVTRPHVTMEGEMASPSRHGAINERDPFLPIEDVLMDLVGHDGFKRLIDNDQVRITPLAQMRGRTFNECFIVVDDAQNLSVRNMRMVATRLGRGSRMVVTGDPDHTELLNNEPSGLQHLLGLVDGKGLALVHAFEKSQIIRNDLVARLDALYTEDAGSDVRAAA